MSQDGTNEVSPFQLELNWFQGERTSQGVLCMLPTVDISYLQLAKKELGGGLLLITASPLQDTQSVNKRKESHENTYGWQ